MKIRTLTLLAVVSLLVGTEGPPLAVASETVLYAFSPTLHGAYPEANVCLGPNGKIYGTTTVGGAQNAGAVWKVDGNRQTVLYSFTGGADGGEPWANVTCDPAGKLYGTAVFGGAFGQGVVFKIDSGRETVLYSFTGGADGGNPFYGVVEDAKGNLYGTAYDGSTGAGVVFKLDKHGNESVLYTFTGGADGGYPNNVIRDSAGNLYGTTYSGGSGGAGVVFKLSPPGGGSGPWTESVLYNFTGASDGGTPYYGVIEDPHGNFYGTTTGGGVAGYGVVFEVDSMGNETVLYSFTDGSDGGFPTWGVTLDSAGNLYGTAGPGVSAEAGVVFELTPSGDSWTETTLYTFTGGADGYGPSSGVILDSAGNLYGNTVSGGDADFGAIFKVSPPVTGQTNWTESVLYGFPGTDGMFPSAGLTRDRVGDFYGTTPQGGSDGEGVIFKLDQSGHETLLHSFTGGADGGFPLSELLRDSDGNFYGTAARGGSTGGGVVFKFDERRNETVLYNFTGGADGGFPGGGLIIDSAGNLYGTTDEGGAAGFGTVYKLDPAGNETVLHSFGGGPFDGEYPQSGVIMDSSGNLYGTTNWGGGIGCSVFNGCGTVYKLDPSGHETLLYSFTGGNDGELPAGGLVLDSAGSLYGTTYSGGPPSGDYPGTVYKIDSAGNFSVIYPFTGFSDGNGSLATLVFDPNGNLYGTTQYGGQGSCPNNGCGVVFELTAPSGGSGYWTETVLYSFLGGSDGAQPESNVLLDDEGNIFGTTAAGGPGTEVASPTNGVVFEVTPGGDSPRVAQPVQSSLSPSDLSDRHALPVQSRTDPAKPKAVGCSGLPPSIAGIRCQSTKIE